MNEDPLVSVIIPTRNRAALLEKSLESLLVQSYPNIELVIVDGGSADHTEARVRPLLVASGRPFCYHWQENRGVYAALNKGIALASGSLLSFGASDDLWKKEALRELVDFLGQNPGCAVFLCDVEFFDGSFSGRGLFPDPPPQTGRMLNDLFALNFASLAGCLIKRQVFREVGLFDCCLKASADYDMFLRMAVRFEFGILSKKLYMVREHGDRITSDQSLLRERYQVLTRFLRNYPGLVPKEIVRRRMRQVTTVLGDLFLRLGRPQTALRHLAESLRYGLPSSMSAKNMVKSALRLLY